jgi:peroxiredoxin
MYRSPHPPGETTADVGLASDATRRMSRRVPWVYSARISSRPGTAVNESRPSRHPERRRPRAEVPTHPFRFPRPVRMKFLPVLALIATPFWTPLSAQQSATRDMRPVYSYLALPQVGRRVPEFQFALVTGGTITPAALQGSPTVLILWATWCGPCRSELKDVESLRASYAPRGVRVVILAEDSMADLQRFRDSVPVVSPLAAAPDRQPHRNATASVLRSRCPACSYSIEWARWSTETVAAPGQSPAYERYSTECSRRNADDGMLTESVAQFQCTATTRPSIH